MAEPTNKERIERLEVNVYKMTKSVQNWMPPCELYQRTTDRLHQFKETMRTLTEARVNFESSLESSPSSQSIHQGEHNHTSCSQAQPHFIKMDFPRYLGTTPTELLNCVEQFFKYQGTTVDQRVALILFHLEGEANQWYQWLELTYGDVTWNTFVEELCAWFGLTGYEDFDEALSKIRQMGIVHEYHQKFERLSMRVRGWLEKGLLSAFIGGLKEEKGGEVRMFKPQSLRHAIEVSRMREE